MTYSHIDAIIPTTSAAPPTIPITATVDHNIANPIQVAIENATTSTKQVPKAL